MGPGAGAERLRLVTSWAQATAGTGQVGAAAWLPIEPFRLAQRVLGGKPERRCAQPCAARSRVQPPEPQQSPFGCPVLPTRQAYKQPPPRSPVQPAEPQQSPGKGVGSV